MCAFVVGVGTDSDPLMKKRFINGTPWTRCRAGKGSRAGGSPTFSLSWAYHPSTVSLRLSPGTRLHHLDPSAYFRFPFLCDFSLHVPVTVNQVPILRGGTLTSAHGSSEASHRLWDLPSLG